MGVTPAAFTAGGPLSDSLHVRLGNVTTGEPVDIYRWLPESVLRVGQ